MADVTKIPGTTPNDPPRGPREPTKPGTEKFRELMKVDKSDEEQKKKKRNKTQAEEERRAQLRTAAASAERRPEHIKPVKFTPKVRESEKRQPQQQKRREETAAADEAAAAAAASASRQQIQSIEKVTNEVAASQAAASSTPPRLPPLENPPEEIQEKGAAEEQKIEQEEQAALQKLHKKEAISQETAKGASLPASSTLGPLFIPPAPESAPAYTLLSSDSLTLFEYMVSQIFIMQANGRSETTIHLDTPQFASSIFAGAQIVIREYSTAPLAYNIEFLGNTQNTLLFERNIESLRAAFASEKRNYTVNRIEAHLQREERPLFHRKESVGDEEKNSSS